MAKKQAGKKCLNGLSGNHKYHNEQIKKAANSGSLFLKTKHCYLPKILL